jgi:hypothetical protein
MKRLWILLMLIALLLIAGSALAMSSTNYRLDWFAPLTSSGGPATSAHYAGSFSVGQSVIGYADSAGYTAGLGYWYGAAGGYKIYLPLVLKG